MTIKMNQPTWNIASVIGKIFVIAVGLLAFLLVMLPVQASPDETVDYSAVFDAEYYAEQYSDLKEAFGTDEAALLNHFITCGMAEGRQGNAEFNVQAYKAAYEDLQAAYGDDLPAYYMHYIICGKAEGRTAIEVAQPAEKTNLPALVEHDPYYWQYLGNCVANTDVRNGWDGGMGLQILAYCNIEREKAGLKGFAWNESMIYAAQYRARELVTNYSSTSVGGYNKGYTENILWYREDGFDAMYGTAGNGPGWFTTGTSRVHIMNGDYGEMGAGVYIDENGVAYFVQLFR